MGDFVTTILVAVLYYRVSTEEQGKKGYSLPEQRRECMAKANDIAREQGARLQVYEFEDHASGEILERPGLEACRNFLSTNKAQVFICLDPDRFSRSLNLQLLVANEIEARGTDLVFISHEYRKTAEGKLFFQLRGAISEFEKAKILERTRRGRRGKLASGGIPNYISTYGYRWNLVSKDLEVNEETAPWVRQIFEWYADGWSYQRIAERLMELGVKSARRDHWHKTSIMRIVRNSTYVGRLVLNRWDCEGNGPLRSIPKEKRSRPRTDRPKPQEDWVTIEIPAIIDESLWERAQAAHVNRTRLMQRGVALLSGLCYCGLCGGRVHYMGDPKHRYFRCKNRYPHLLDPTDRPAEACKWRDLKSHMIDQAIWRRVVAWLQDPDSLRRERERQLAEANQPQTSSNERIATLERELHLRQEEQRRTYYLFTKGLAPAGAEADLERLASQIQSLERELTNLRAAQQAQPAASRPLPDDLAAIREGLLNKLENFTLEQRQQVVRFLIQRVTVWPDGRFDYALK